MYIPRKQVAGAGACADHGLGATAGLLQVFPKVKTTLTESQAIRLQNALSSAMEDGMVSGNRMNNRM